MQTIIKICVSLRIMRNNENCNNYISINQEYENQNSKFFCIICNKIANYTTRAFFLFSVVNIFVYKCKFYLFWKILLVINIFPTLCDYH